MKNITKLLSVTLILVLIISMSGTLKVNSKIVTQDVKDYSQESSIKGFTNNSSFSAENELIELRNLNSKSFLNDDGSITVITYITPIHYKDRNGLYQEIKNKIIENNEIANDGEYRFTNSSNKWSVNFNDMKEGNHPVLLSDNDETISFALYNPQPSEANKVPDNEFEYMNDYGIDILSDNSVIYNNVYEGIDVVYTVIDNGIKENIILNEPTDKNEFIFIVKTEGLRVEDRDGIISFIDDNDKVKYIIDDLFAVDSTGAVTMDVVCEVNLNNDHYILKVTVDKNYLKDEKRVWPVFIDPTIIHMPYIDLSICSTSPYSDYNNYGDTILGTGRDSTYGAVRTYMHFNPYVPANPNIESAYIGMVRHSSSGTVNIRAYQVLGSWDTSINWHNKPSESGFYRTATYYDANLAIFDVTELVRDALDYPAYNHGVMIRDANESSPGVWAKWYSSFAANLSDRPFLQITYKYGNRAYNHLVNTTVNCAGYALKPSGYASDWSDWYEFDITIAGLNNCNNESEIWDYTLSKVENWIDANINYNKISSYNSYIASNKYKVVLRMGYEDVNNNGIVDIDFLDSHKDNYDFHWWFQTSPGEWADKSGGSPSKIVPYTSGITNPYFLDWPNSYYGDPAFYDSQCVYYAIHN